MICIGLGSNLGDRKKYLRRAFDELCEPHNGREPLIKNVRISSIYESEALLPPAAPASWNLAFFNMVLVGETNCQPQELLTYLKAIEKKLGRKIHDRWAPREIDLDILAWENLITADSNLKIPHEGLLDRPFVILPMTEVIPNWFYPAEGVFKNQTVATISTRWTYELQSIRKIDDTVLAPDIVGILNITPDSFSDGGEHIEKSKAIEQAQKLIAQGARIIDIGAESTRPGATAVSVEEEWRRLEPILKELVPEAKKNRVSISVDTRHFEIAKKSLKANVNWINDVSGFEDQNMIEAVAESECDMVFMHSLGVPPIRLKTISQSVDCIEFLLKWGGDRIKMLEGKGISRERLIFDPGIGFGKTIDQNLKIINKAHKFLDLGVRVLIGHSRKSFLNHITVKPFSERDVESLVLSIELAKQKIHYLRVHQVEWHSRAFRTLHLSEQTR